MNLIGVPVQLFEAAMVLIGTHTPAYVEFGKPLCALMSDAETVCVITTVGHWYAAEGIARRAVPLPDGRVELTAFSCGEELSRTIA